MKWNKMLKDPRFIKTLNELPSTMLLNRHREAKRIVNHWEFHQICEEIYQENKEIFESKKEVESLITKTINGIFKAFTHGQSLRQIDFPHIGRFKRTRQGRVIYTIGKYRKKKVNSRKGFRCRNKKVYIPYSQPIDNSFVEIIK